MRRYFHLLLSLFFLIACSSQAAQESFVTQQPSQTLQAISITPSLALTPTIMAQILPAPSPTQVDFDNLPKLKDVVLSSTEIDDATNAFPPIVIGTKNNTNELQNSCPEDCAKFRFSLNSGSFLTIVLSRAGNRQEAESIVLDLRESFLKSETNEYSTNELTSVPPNAWVEYTTDSVFNVPPNAWVILDGLVLTGDFHTSVASVAHGNVVVLIIYSQIYCGYTPEYGKMCEGDLAYLVFQTIEYLNAQTQKLEVVGYPK
jgi:hypothetical protein